MTAARATYLTAEAETRDNAPRTDAELVRVAQQGDTEAFSCLVARHQHMVYNLACRFMREPALAEDMAQEAFIKAYRLLSGFRGDCSFSTWLYRVTASVCLSELSKRRKRGEIELLPVHEKADEPRDHERSDLPELLRKCVAMLPDRYESIVNLYYFQQSSYEEIARLLQIPMGTLKIWMHRARNELKKIIKKELRLNGCP